MAKEFPIFKDESGVADPSSVLVLDETTTPSSAANQAKLYAKDVSGVSKMHALDSDGVEIELGTGGGTTTSAVGPQHSNNDFSPGGRWVLNGNLLDSSGNGNDLTLAAGTELYAGHSHVTGDSSAVFDITRYTTGSIAALETLGAITIMAWINPRALNNYILVSYQGAGETEANNVIWSLRININGQVKVFHEFGSGSNEDIDSVDNVVVQGENQHLTLARESDGVTYHVYHNGVFVETIVAGNAPTGGSGSFVNIGAGADGESDFFGSIWDVVAIPSLLTSQEIADEYLRQAGQNPVLRVGRTLHDTTHDPIGLWQLQGNGLDSSGNGRDITATSPETGNGHVGVAAHIDSNDTAYHSLADAALQLTGAMSAYAIVNSAGNGTILAWAASGETEATNALYWLQIAAGILTYDHEFSSGSNASHTSSATISTNEWCWVGFTRDSAGTTVRMYINGEEVSSETLSNAPTGGGSGSFSIGTLHSTGGSPFNGQIQSVKVVGSELTASQMRAEYERCFGVGAATSATHAEEHLLGGSDEIDADQLDIDFTPSNYTPSTTPAEVTSVDHLSAHLAGVDTALAPVTAPDTDAAPGATPTIDWSSNRYQEITLSANITSISFTAPSAIGEIILVIKQPSAGGPHTVTGWDASVLWAGGTEPTITSAADAIDVLKFHYDGTNYFGVYDQNYS